RCRWPDPHSRRSRAHLGDDLHRRTHPDPGRAVTGLRGGPLARRLGVRGADRPRPGHRGVDRPSPHRGTGGGLPAPGQLAARDDPGRDLGMGGRAGGGARGVAGTGGPSSGGGLADRPEHAPRPRLRRGARRRDGLARRQHLRWCCERRHLDHRGSHVARRCRPMGPGGARVTGSTSSARAWIGTIVFLLLAPGVVAGLVPWLITGWRPHDWGGLAWLILPVAWLVIASGAAFLLYAFGLFAAHGGTPAPLAPTQTLVVTGVYRFVRNPMYVAVLATILGQALLFGSWWLVL